MTEQAAQRRMKVRRISLPAFETAMAAATEEGAAAPAGDADESWAELARAELASGQTLRPEWSRALAASPGAPIQIRVVARDGEVSFETDLTLLPGLGLARTQRTHLARTADGYEPVGREPAVELVAFPPEQVWPAVRRVIPDREVLRAAARPTPLSRQRHLVLDPAVAQQLPDRVAADPFHRTPGAVLESLVHDDELSAVLAGGDAEVAVVVVARTGEHDLAPVGSSRWTVVGDDLYSIRTTRDRIDVVAVEAGDVAHEVVYHVAGAVNLLERVAKGEVPA